MKRVFTIVLVISIALVACTKTDFKDGRLVHDEQTSMGEGDRIVNLAYNEHQFIGLWDYYNFDGERPRLDFDDDATIFLQTGENSCPKQVDGFELNDKGILLIDTVQKESNCDDIGLERTFVMQLEKEKLQEVKVIVFEGEEFEVPIVRGRG